MTKARFQADADLRQAIVTGVIRRQPNLDFQSALDSNIDPRLLKEVGELGVIFIYTHLLS